MEKISDRLWRKAGVGQIPLTGAFELLPICNLSCKMCYVRKSRAEVDAAGGLLPADEWLDFALQARDYGLLYPLLTGGEPFLRDDLCEILSGMQQMGLQVSINSNAALIDEPTARWLGKHRPTRINITLYGSSEESYQKLCGDGSAFGRVRKAVEYLKKYNVPVKFNSSITPENVGDMEEIISYAKSVGSPIQVATYMFPPIRRDAAMAGKNHRLSPEEAGLARVRADWLQNEPDWFRGQAARFSRFVPITDEMLASQGEGESREMSCRAGRCSFWLDWQGNMGNCGMYTSVKVPAKGRNFADVWKEVADLTAKVRYCPVCSNCPNRWLCHSCIAMVYCESGDQDGRPDYICKMNAAAARYYQEYAKMLPKKEAADTDFDRDQEKCFLDEI